MEACREIHRVARIMGSGVRPGLSRFDGASSCVPCPRWRKRCGRSLQGRDGAPPGRPDLRRDRSAGAGGNVSPFDSRPALGGQLRGLPSGAVPDLAARPQDLSRRDELGRLVRALSRREERVLHEGREVLRLVPCRQRPGGRRRCQQRHRIAGASGRRGSARPEGRDVPHESRFARAGGVPACDPSRRALRAMPPRHIRHEDRRYEGRIAG